MDIAHSVAPGDVEGAAFLLAAAAPSFPPATVHLAVVDPGVGGARRILAARAGASFFVAPDNGLLSPVLDAAEVRSVERRELFRAAPGETFHGRDRFAPVAAALLRGEPLNGLGPEVSDPVRLELPAPERRAGRLSGRVVHADRFGNLITDIPSSWLTGRAFEARIGEHRIRRRASHYAELAAGEPAVIPGSLGTLELSLAGDSLLRRWGLGRGTPVTVELH